MCEHVLSGKTIVNIACGIGRLRCSLIRVCPPQEFGCGMLSAGACEVGRFLCSANRVRHSPSYENNKRAGTIFI